MIQNRFRRNVSVFAASAVALGVSTASFAVSTASASSAHATGVTSTSVTIGATVPLSGIASGYAEVSAAAQAVFKYQNAHGKVNGRTVNYIRLDDCYDTPGFGCTQSPTTTTYTQTQQLVTNDHVFATVGSLGTAAQDSVRNYLKSAGTPQLFVNSGSSDWNNPSVYPGLFGFQASYKVEGKNFAQYIFAHYNGQKVGFFGQNDDFGANGYAGLTGGPHAVSIAANDKTMYNVADAVLNTGDLKSGLLKMEADHVKVVVLDSIPPVTKQILVDAHNDGFAPKWIISSVGSDPKSVNTTLENGAISFDGFAANNDKTNAWNKFTVKVLLADKTDFPKFTATTPLDGNQQYGVAFAVAFLEALKSLGANPTQSGIVNAMLTTKFAGPAVEPFGYSATNHQGLQCGLFSTIVSTATTKATTTPVKAVTCTTDTPGGALTAGKYAVAPIPSWL